MSALPVISPTTGAPTSPDQRRPGAGAPPLRIVTMPRPVRVRDPLAPTSRGQAVRRRVAVVAVLVLAMALLLSVVGGALGDAAAGAPVPVADTVVVVQPGDTVWGIAQEHAPPGVSTASYAGRIVERNGLDGGAVDQWQVLRLP